VFRDYPLPFHPQAQKAHEAGACAHEQGKFWEMHDQMFADQDKLEAEALKVSARAIGLDGAKFDACLDSGKFARHIQDEFKAGQEAGVTGTPAFFINGRPLGGAVPIEAFRKLIDKELAAKK
jgi:protein-disulfide isomerase